MNRKSKWIMCAALILVSISFMPLMAFDGAEGMRTRAPLYEGHISSDDTWSDGEIKNVVIDPGVTITMTAGSYYEVTDDGFFYIEGTLIINGEEGNEVEITHAMTSWQGIGVNATGRVVIRNASISYGDSCIMLGGLPSLIENTEISEGENGIVITSTGNRIEGCTVNFHSRYGVYYRSATGPNYLNHTTIDRVGEIGLFVEGTTGLRTSNIDIVDNHLGMELVESTDLELVKTSVMPPSPSSSAGIAIGGLLTGVKFTGLVVDNLKVGVMFMADEGSKVLFENAAIGPNIDTGLLEEAGNHVHAVLINSRITADNTAIGIEDPDHITWIDLINTTIGGGDIVIKKGGFVNASWWMDLTVTDANTDPLDCNLKLWNETRAIVEMELPEGRVTLPVISVYWVVGTNQGEKMSTRFEITSNDESRTVLFTDWEWIDENGKREIWVNLWPINNMPEALEVDEDTWLDLELDDYFSDPEGQDLTFGYSHGPELQVNRIGGPGSGTLKIRNDEDNWYGDSWLNVSAEDPMGNLSLSNVTVHVLSVNDHPYLVDPPLPELTTEEDHSTCINFTGLADDVESEPTWTAEEVEGCTLSWDTHHINLTITPDENWFGMLEIPLNISDGEDWLHETLYVNVTPVNDLPDVAFMWPNGTEVETVEYVWNETVNITVYEIGTLEDTPVAFWINATDVETAELTYYFREEDLLHGVVEVESYSYLNETNQTVTVEIPMNFTYTPAENDHAGDLVMFNVSDGEEDLSYWIWFHVESVNDRPTFDPPAEWNITVDEGNLTVLDIAGMIGDVDGDPLTITVDPDDYVSVNGTTLEILYNASFDKDMQNVTITVSDGKLGASAVLTIQVHRETIPGDDDDDEPELGTLNVTADEDGWTFEIEGDEGQTLYIVVVDSGGNRTSYPMTYAGGRYSVIIGKEDAEEGMSYYLTDEEDGESLGDETAGTLTALIEGEDDEDEDFPFWVLLLIAILVILVIVVIAVVLAASRGKGGYEEE